MIDTVYLDSTGMLMLCSPVDPQRKSIIEYLDDLFKAGGKLASSPIAMSEFDSAIRKLLKKNDYSTVTDASLLEQRIHFIRDAVELWLSNDPSDIPEARVYQQSSGVSFNTAIHIALMRREAIRNILSLNTELDRVSGISRITFS